MRRQVHSRYAELCVHVCVRESTVHIGQRTSIEVAKFKILCTLTGWFVPGDTIASAETLHILA